MPGLNRSSVLHSPSAALNSMGFDRPVRPEVLNLYTLYKKARKDCTKSLMVGIICVGIILALMIRLLNDLCCG